ncbi:Methyltransf_16 domain-containing protein [Cephalotus follicularis]|uniref:protein-histidine N-methyltransferase n=1 Tax=Cephalotus follicularis TaxID=3775 RepID=A0A1Q3ATJ5_CEPFO|nr:Methyltransf_16 domain-containing protein [Cephalotus follicularis]
MEGANAQINEKAIGLSFLEDTPPAPLPLPPPSTEVFSTKVSSSVKFTIDPINLGGLTLLKGRVNTKEVLGLSESDLVPGVYEGGLKLWEGSLDLVKTLQSEIRNGNWSFTGKRVLELGCGHGLPGIFACLEGAAVIHFQDFNAEVLRCLTIPNVNVNLSKASHSEPTSEIRYFAGDWSQIHQLLAHVHDNGKDLQSSSKPHQVAGYDVILMAETIYSNSANQNLYGLVKKCISRPHGIVYMAAKKYYFGVGGGTRQFLSMVEKDGVMTSSLVADIADGSSNVREIWKLSLK